MNEMLNTVIAWFTPEVIAIIVAMVKAVVILLATVIAAALLSFVERRLLAWWQDRYGPNRVGPYGIFQLAADMLKMFFKEDWTPPFADKLIFWLAPAVAMSALLLVMAVAFTLLFFTLHLAAMRNEIMRRRVRTLLMLQADAAGGH